LGYFYLFSPAVVILKTTRHGRSALKLAGTAFRRMGVLTLPVIVLPGGAVQKKMPMFSNDKI
jgi:hypothetical protein